jgi:hypothetical protein
MNWRSTMKHALPVAIILAVFVTAGTATYAFASHDSRPAATPDDATPVRPIDAFSEFVAGSTAATDVSDIADEITDALSRRKVADLQPGLTPRRIPNESRTDLSVLLGDEFTVFIQMVDGKLAGWDTAFTKLIAGPEIPLAFFDRAEDDTIVLTALRPDNVTQVKIVTAAGFTITLDVVDGVASTRLPDRPASFTSITKDGGSHTFIYDTEQPLEEILPPTRAERAKLLAAEAAELAASAGTNP